MAAKSRTNSPKQVKASEPDKAKAGLSRSQRAALRPQEILDAARNLFATKGFFATRMEDVARDAGVTKPIVYRHFTSKEQLFEALVRSEALPEIELLAEMTKAHEGRLREFAALFTRGAKAWQQGKGIPTYARVALAEFMQVPRVADYVRETLLSPLLAEIARFFEGEMKRGDMRRDDPLIAARLFVSPLFFGTIMIMANDIATTDHLDTLYQKHVENFLLAYVPPLKRQK